MKTTKQNKVNNIQYEFKCNMCTKRFFNKTLLQQHKKIHNMTYSCKLCSYSGKTVKYLSRHTKKVHTEPTISCNVCNKKFHFQCNLKQHLLVHTGAKPHKCKVCGKGFNSSYSLSTHKLIHENLKPYLCTICDYACRDSSTLRKHKDRHLGIVKRYQCELCPRLFNANIYLKMHMDEKHFGINVHKISCKFCDKMFKSNSTLNMHIRTIHGRQYECECAICGTICKDKGNLRAHMMCHVDIRPYKCTYKSCGKKFKCMGDLKKHIIIHYPEQQHKCFCGRRFARKLRYDVHIKQHKHKEKTIQCDMCGEWFNNKSQIKLHIAKIHIDRYICDVCGYQTNNKTSIVVHIKEGHNQSCNICGETFERHLKLHYLKCHSIKYKKPRLKHKEVLEETDFKKEIENMELFEVEKQEILSDIEHEETNLRENHRIGKTINSKNNLEKELNRPVDKATIINKNVDLIEKIKRINVTVKIDKKAKENAEKHIQKLLDKSTRQKEMKELEETRQMYNERIRQAINSKPKKGPVIKFIKINNNANENNESQNNDIQSQFNDAKINDNEIVRRNNKLKINTHQCYVCFKLFETKPKLIEHCIEHFDVCCDVMLKKCPLCDYVTKLNLSRHMKLIHKINIQLPYTRFKDKKHNNNGSRYYYDINNKNIDKIEIIPSVRNLNKIESMKIDKKRKIKKTFSIDKKKLIKKGNEWIVGDEEVKIKNDYLITNFNIEDLLKIKVIGDDYLSKLKKLSHIAKNKGEKMLFPCENCEKICQTLSALKLHTRKHNPNAKPFKKKLWKNKINGKEIEKNTNRYEKPKPILNKHKCDKELKDFYENNIKGGDIEFWQFLKIYNKISKENITEFSELYKRTDFGIHYELTNDELTKKKENKSQKEEIKKKKVVKKTPKFSRVVKMSKKQYLKRMEIKNKLRQNISNIIC